MTTTKATPRGALPWLLFLFVSVLYSLWFYQLQSDTAALQTTADKDLSASEGSYTRAVRLKNDVSPIVIAKNDPFRDSSQWAYVAPSSPVGKSYTGVSLKDFSQLPHAPGVSVHLSSLAGKALENLFSDARRAGHPLALSSAYRSVSDQQALYDSYVVRHGREYTERYVAQPQTSEHHTGLAVDISDYSAGCLVSADDCSLSSASANWLATYAPLRGFILRYPDGKESITGVAYEPWHFRYIGPAAQQLTKSGLTLDEFVQKVESSS